MCVLFYVLYSWLFYALMYLFGIDFESKYIAFVQRQHATTAATATGLQPQSSGDTTDATDATPTTTTISTAASTALGAFTGIINNECYHVYNPHPPLPAL